MGKLPANPPVTLLDELIPEARTLLKAIGAWTEPNRRISGVASWVGPGGVLTAYEKKGVVKAFATRGPISMRELDITNAFGLAAMIRWATKPDHGSED